MKFYFTLYVYTVTHWDFEQDFLSSIWYFHNTDFQKTIILTGNDVKLAIFCWWYSHWNTKLNFQHDKKLTRWRQHLEILKSLLKSVISPLPIHAQGCYGCQKKRNCKGVSKSLVWCAVFQSEWRKVEKCLEKQSIFVPF